jgi:small ligand-binding sensory domain FIST
MQRDEQYIFDGVERLMQRMKDDLEGRRPVAVFHADCMARGRHMFNRVLKDEIIAKMQYPLCGEEVVPWLGVYGYSEYCRFAGKNQFHSYTTSLFPIVRREG